MKGAPVDVKRQHLDDDGKINNDNEMNKHVIAFLEDLVDTEKAHIRFQVCSH
jgi:hypothetical protein